MNEYKINNVMLMEKSALEQYASRLKVLFSEKRSEILAGTQAAGQSSGIKVSRIGQDIAVIPIHGSIDYRPAEWMKKYLGVVDVLDIESAMNEMLNDSKVGTIIFHIDSPGGSSTGINELSQKIYEARGKKRMVSIADPLAASAAYWIGTSTSEMYMIPSGLVGSVGVYMMHLDYSKMLEEVGIKPTFIFAGEKKVDGNPYEPLSESAKETYQAMVDEIYDQFVSSVARNRNLTSDAIKSDFQKGDVATAKTAFQNKMVDGILTLDQLLKNEVTRLSGDSENRAFVEIHKYKLMIEGVY